MDPKNQHSEYLSRASNKVSLMVWTLINNNQIGVKGYIALQAIEFAFNIILILSFYTQAGVSPLLSSGFL